jgi:uncharacterized cysteine cluster protein YcgN (CxxCxxCC family)
MIRSRVRTGANHAARAQRRRNYVPIMRTDGTQPKTTQRTMTATADRFWETTPLSEMTQAQWEALCDGCAKCCLEKLEDVDTRRIVYTNVACRLLDRGTCRCTDYTNRSKVVPTCVTLTLAVLGDPYWLPATCAYRLLAEGQPLPDWHPLLTGDPSSVAKAGQGVGGWVISEEAAGPLVHHLIDWVE